MKTKRFNRKSIVFLFAIAVFFCGVQSLSFGQTLTASTPAPLTETTLHGSVVTLTLQGASFGRHVLPSSLLFSGIWGVSAGHTGTGNIERLSDTEIRVRLEFSGDFDRDGTLTIEVLYGFHRSATTELPVTATMESITVTRPASLTEATLHNSTVTLTLQGRTFKENIGSSDVSVSGISGVRVGDVKYLSDTQIRVRLEFNGVLDRDDTLTFTVSDSGIKNYSGSNLTDEIRVTATTESLTATTSAPLTEATLDNSTVILTLRGRTFEDSEWHLETFYLKISGISRVSVGNVRLLSNTEAEVTLKFTGNLSSDGTLTFRVSDSGIKNYNGSELTATLPVSATVETQTPVAPTPQPNVVSTPQPQVVTTPQPTVVYIPDANLRAAIQQEIGNTLTTNTMLNLTTLNHAYNSGIRDLTGLEHARNLRSLNIWSNNISDISPLAGLTQLTYLNIRDNNISDVSPLTRLTQLTTLIIYDNNISDISALAGLTQLTDSELQSNNISDVSPLARLTQLTTLNLWDNNISDISALAGLTQLTTLNLSGNNISDVSPLVGLTQLEGLYLSGNNISDISPLVGLTRLTNLGLRINPLNAAAINTHIPAIQARGTNVLFDNRAPATPQPPVVTTPQPPVVTTPQPTVVTIPDVNLRRAIQQRIGNTITTNTLLNLTDLIASGGIRDLTGLQHATNLTSLYLRGNGNNIRDISALSGLTQLTDLELWNSNTSDISALSGLTQRTQC